MQEDEISKHLQCGLFLGFLFSNRSCQAQEIIPKVWDIVQIHFKALAYLLTLLILLMFLQSLLAKASVKRLVFFFRHILPRSNALTGPKDNRYTCTFRAYLS